MDQWLGGFRAALLVGWMTLSAAGVMYARWKGIPVSAAVPVLAAFLIEYSFYLVSGFTALRQRLERRLPLFLTVSFVAPYAVYASSTGQFRWWALIQLAALAMVLSLWYRVLPHAPWADGAFLALVAAVVLRNYLGPIYTSPVAGLHLETLGHLALIHVCAMVMLVERRVSGTGFGFLPSWADWKIGLRYFLYCIVAAVPLAWAMQLGHFSLAMPLWKVGLTFFGMLWVVALSEEFFFRGLLQQWMAQWTGSAPLALIGTAILFGLVHLGFRGFPNWRFALVAAVAGVFYGLAYNEAKSIRASMVTHALLVSLWRALFP